MGACCGTKNTNIFEASNSNDVGTMQQLIDTNRVDWQQRDASGNTILHNAVSQNSSEQIQLLIKYQDKQDINAFNDDHNTALHIASKMGSEDMVKQLLMWNGVNTGKRNNDQDTPGDVADSNAIRELINGHSQ